MVESSDMQSTIQHIDQTDSLNQNQTWLSTYVFEWFSWVLFSLITLNEQIIKYM